MSDNTPKGTRSRLGPNAEEGMPGESDRPDARRDIAEEAVAETAEQHDSKPDGNKSGET